MRFGLTPGEAILRIRIRAGAITKDVPLRVDFTALQVLFGNVLAGQSRSYVSNNGQFALVDVDAGLPGNFVIRAIVRFP